MKDRGACPTSTPPRVRLEQYMLHNRRLGLCYVGNLTLGAKQRPCPPASLPILTGLRNYSRGRRLSQPPISFSTSCAGPTRKVLDPIRQPPLPRRPVGSCTIKYYAASHRLRGPFPPSTQRIPSERRTITSKMRRPGVWKDLPPHSVPPPPPSLPWP